MTGEKITWDIINCIEEQLKEVTDKELIAITEGLPFSVMQDNITELTAAQGRVVLKRLVKFTLEQKREERANRPYIPSREIRDMKAALARFIVSIRNDKAKKGIL